MARQRGRMTPFERKEWSRIAMEYSGPDPTGWEAWNAAWTYLEENYGCRRPL